MSEFCKDVSRAYLIRPRLDSEDAQESVQPLDLAGTYRMATKRVPAPRLELGTP